MVIGIDEVGRGPLAGPVVVCALAIMGKARIANRKSLPPLRDSKRLSEQQRLAWYEWIKNNPRIKFAVSRVYPRRIERLNISEAANLAATRAFLKVTKLFPPPSKEGGGVGGGCDVFLDGGLYLRVDPRKYPRLSASTIIKGDEKIPAIMLASIVAKVTRDRFMKKLHLKYPQYGFDRHKGYGTAVHLAAIKKFGPSRVHRATFLPNSPY